MPSTNPADWLSRQALPLWLERGAHPGDGGFIECLSQKGDPESVPRRTLVQARQIYAFRTARELGVCDPARALALIESGTRFLLERCSLPDGSFCFSIDPQGHRQGRPELYTQAFALFGLANAFAVLKRPELKERALELIAYLEGHRRGLRGGFTEMTVAGLAYQSNPHMHLFEALLFWMDSDSEPVWRTLADEILDLALTKMIDPASGALAEHFDEGWSPLREEGRFIFEPGHQYEWSWLMGLHQKLTGRDLMTPRKKLFAVAERTGLHPDRPVAMDELWSDFSVRTDSARFWPQCERIKAAAQLGEWRAADEALRMLFLYLETPLPGLWFDRMSGDGVLQPQSAKASSFYHIIGALSEYERHRR